MILIAYDIKSNKKRFALAKELLKYGIRTQKSLFEFNVANSQKAKLIQIVENFSNREDRVELFEITNRDSIKRVGKVSYLQIDDFIM